MRLDKARQILNESGYTLVEDFSIKQKYQEFDMLHKKYSKLQ